MNSISIGSFLLFIVAFIMIPATMAAQRIRQDAPSSIKAIRFFSNPIISETHREFVGDNVNGPSLIRVPSWIKNPLGRYYLYFAHHHGTSIRLAYADSLAGPWTIYQPGTLKLEQTICSGHIASPDVHVDDNNKTIRMYFHGPHSQTKKQVSFVATSSDGLNFTASSEVLGESYFRVFLWDGWCYAIARLGVLFRSRDGLSRFERGGNPLESDSIPSNARHLAVSLVGNTLSIFYSRIGDSPERIMMAKIVLTENWKRWKATDGVTLLEPEMPYEGVDLPVRPSQSGEIKGRARELRDPAVFQEGGRTYVLYSVAGESGIGIAELR